MEKRKKNELARAMAGLLVVAALAGAAVTLPQSMSAEHVRRSLNEYMYYGYIGQSMGWSGQPFRIKIGPGWTSEDYGAFLGIDDQNMDEMRAAFDPLNPVPYFALLDAWSQSQNNQDARDITMMSGKITETSRDDGTALVKAVIHYEDVPLQIWTLQSWYGFLSSWDPNVLVPLVSEGRMKVTVVEEFIIPHPGATLYRMYQWEHHKFTMTAVGEGGLTGEGGFDPGRAKVEMTFVFPPAADAGQVSIASSVGNIKMTPLGEE